ncbi:MAG: hypothetical protein HKN70_04550, partial [Gammaproteobacteria bacterium]|nr:hypothetical protein [Gammaproteobacteria bacterium]
MGATDGGKPGSGTAPLNPITNPYVGAANDGFPRISLDFGYMDYFAADGFMSLVGLELSIQIGPADPPVIIPGGSLMLQLFLDNTGALVSG